MDAYKKELAQYLYEKLKQNTDGSNQVYLGRNDYEKVKTSSMNENLIIDVNKVLIEFQNEGYILCSRLKDVHIYAAWITITDKMVELFKKEGEQK